ncbi:hypothetical protein TSMEX_002372 [Taenia solium]
MNVDRVGRSVWKERGKPVQLVQAVLDDMLINVEQRLEESCIFTRRDLSNSRKKSRGSCGVGEASGRDGAMRGRSVELG